MIVTEKVLAAALKDIGIALHIISIRPASRLPRKYSMAKANYFYGKTGEDVKKWLTEIDRVIEANNMANERKVTVAAAYLRDAIAD